MPAHGGLLTEAKLTTLAVRVACHVVPPLQFTLAEWTPEAFQIFRSRLRVGQCVAVGGTGGLELPLQHHQLVIDQVL